jgi:hypothetical protein
MSTILDPATGYARPPAGGELLPSPVSTPVLAALRAAAACLVPVLVPVVLGWVLGAGGQATWIQAARLAVGLWLLAHHAGLTVAGGHVGLVPVGLATLPLIACWYAGRRLARTMDPNAERIAAGATRAKPVMPSWRVLATFSTAYCVIAGLASPVATMPGVAPVTYQAVLGAAVTSVVGVVLGAASYRFGGGVRGLEWVLSRLPEQCQPWLRPAAAAVAVQLAAGVLLVGALIGFGVPRVLALHHALQTGRVGGAVLIFGELLLLPNLVLWACAAMAGPGFAIGAGSSVTLGATTLGPLPAIPVLAALPAPGTAPAPAWGLLAVPVLAGVVAGWLVVRQAPKLPLAARLGRALGAAVTAGAVMAVLSWLSGGPAGPGRLGAVGPAPLLVGVAVTAELAVGAAASVLLAAGVPWSAHRLTGRALTGRALTGLRVRLSDLARWRPGSKPDTKPTKPEPADGQPAAPDGEVAWWLRAARGSRDRA